MVKRLSSSWVLLVALVSPSCGRSADVELGEARTGGPSAGGSEASAGDAGGSSGAGDNSGAGERSGAGGASGGAGGSGGSSGGGGAGAGPSSRLPQQLNGDPIYTRVQRLTNTQWEHAVTDVLRLEETTSFAEGFQQPVVGVTDFTNNEHLLSVGEREVIDYELASEAAAALATGSAEALAALYEGTDATGFVESFGLRAFRRPLTAAEVAKYLAVFELGETLYGPGFGNGAALVIRGMLQSPHFLYRTELGAVGEPLTGYEVAAKLSLWLLDTTPSDALLESAAQGELEDSAGAVAAARAMLETSAAAQVMLDFHQQLYDLSYILNIVKDAPGYGEATNRELLDVSRAFFDSVFQRDEGLTQILTSTRGYLGPELAALQGLPPAGDGLQELDFGPERVGYFMQLPFLMTHANNLQPDPIHRGSSLHGNVLCTSLPQPTNVDIPSLPVPEPGQTNRDRVTEVTAGCGSPCHDVYINPLGFAFENYDGMGQSRDTDNGQPVDASGSYPLASGEKTFQDAKELMRILAESTESHLCYSRMLSSYALGRDVTESDEPLLDELADVSQGGSLKQLVLALVGHPAFRVRQEAP